MDYLENLRGLEQEYVRLSQSLDTITTEEQFHVLQRMESIVFVHTMVKNEMMTNHRYIMAVNDFVAALFTAILAPLERIEKMARRLHGG